MSGEKERQKDELSLEEAIEHCFERCAEKNDSCGREHRQLGKWLQELKELRAVKYDLGPIEADGPLAVAIDRIDWVTTHIGSVLQSRTMASAGAFMNVPVEFLYSALDGLDEASRRVKEVMAGGLVFRKHAEKEDEPPVSGLFSLLDPEESRDTRPRVLNCDLGSQEEQDARFESFCRGRACVDCPVENHEHQFRQHRPGHSPSVCRAVWAMLPVSVTARPFVARRDAELPPPQQTPQQPSPQACTLRNDQVGTHDEQLDRFYDFCSHHTCSTYDCPVADTQRRSGTADDGCFDTWVGMPVSETEVPRDGEEA